MRTSTWTRLMCKKDHTCAHWIMPLKQKTLTLQRCCWLVQTSLWTLVTKKETNEIRSPFLSAVNISNPKLVSLLLKHDQIDVNQYGFKNLDTIALSRRRKWQGNCWNASQASRHWCEQDRQRRLDSFTFSYSRKEWENSWNPSQTSRHWCEHGWTPLTRACNRGDWAPMMDLDFDSYRHEPEKWPICFTILFIGPRSDHSLPMSVTDWLTH